MRAALTFDAGGNAAGVASILSTLRSTGTPATFFVTGDWTQAFSAQAADIARSYPVGNRTQSHPDLTTRSDAGVRADRRGGHRDPLGNWRRCSPLAPLRRRRSGG